MKNWLDKYSDDGDPINSNNVRESTNVTNVSNLLKQDPIVDNLNDYQISYAKSLLKKHNVTVDSTSNILKDIGLNSSAYYNPLTRTINYKNKGTNKEVRDAQYFHKIIEEIPHAIQADSLGVIPFLGKIAKEGLQYPGRQVYKTKGTLENEAHTILNKKLLDKMGDGGTIPSFPVSANASLTHVDNPCGPGYVLTTDAQGNDICVNPASIQREGSDYGQQLREASQGTPTYVGSSWDVNRDGPYPSLKPSMPLETYSEVICPECSKQEKRNITKSLKRDKSINRDYNNTYDRFSNKKQSYYKHRTPNQGLGIGRFFNNLIERCLPGEDCFKFEDGGETLVPSFWNGSIHTDDEAYERYKQTEKHLGQFNNLKDAERGAQLREFMNNSTPRLKEGGPIKVTDPNDPRLKAYQDSSSMYDWSIRNFESNKKTQGRNPDIITDEFYTWESPGVSVSVPIHNKPVQSYEYQPSESEQFIEGNAVLGSGQDFRHQPGGIFYSPPPIVPTHPIQPNIPLMPKRKQYTFEEPIPLKTKVNQLGPPLALNLFTDFGGSYMDQPQVAPKVDGTTYSPEELAKMGYRGATSSTRPTGGTINKYAYGGEVTSDSDENHISNSREFLKGWYNSPKYKEMLAASVSNKKNPIKEARLINEGRLYGLSVPVKTIPDLRKKQGAFGLNDITTNQIFLDKGFIKENPGLASSLVSHELSHNAYIPKSDIAKIKSFTPAYDPKIHHTSIMKNDPKENYNSLTDPEEVRAMIYGLRNLSKGNNIYDPFTEPATKEHLQQLAPLFQNTESGRSYDQLNRLKTYYTEEQIIDMMNTISENKNVNQNPPMAKDGGPIKYTDVANKYFNAYQEEFNEDDLVPMFQKEYGLDKETALQYARWIHQNPLTRRDTQFLQNQPFNKSYNPPYPPSQGKYKLDTNLNSKQPIVYDEYQTGGPVKYGTIDKSIPGINRDATYVAPSSQQIDYSYNQNVPFGTSNPNVNPFYKKQAAEQFVSQGQSATIKNVDNSEQHKYQKVLNSVSTNNDLLNGVLDFAKFPFQSGINLMNPQIRNDEDVLNTAIDVAGVLPIVRAATKFGIKTVNTGVDIAHNTRTAFNTLNEFKNAEKANELLNPQYLSIKEIPDKVRRIGNIWTNPTSNASEELIKYQRLKKATITDDHLQSLTGLSKKDIDDKIIDISNNIKTAKTINVDNLPSVPTLDDLTRLMQQNRNNTNPRLQNYINQHLDRMENNIDASFENSVLNSTTGILDRTRNFEYQDYLNQLNDNIISNLLRNTPTNTNDNFLNNFLNDKFNTKGINKQINNTILRKYILKSEGDVSTAKGSFYRNNSDVDAELAQIDNYVASAQSGDKIRGAPSLSDSSFPLVVTKLKQHLLNKNLKGVEFEGYNSLSTSGYLNQAGIHPDIIIPYLNSHIKKLSEATGKKIPHAYYEENKGIMFPSLVGVKKEYGGVVKMADGGIVDYSLGSYVKDSGKLLLNTVASPLEQISGNNFVNFEYDNKGMADAAAVSEGVVGAATDVAGSIFLGPAYGMAKSTIQPMTSQIGHSTEYQKGANKWANQTGQIASSVGNLTSGIMSGNAQQIVGGSGQLLGTLGKEFDSKELAISGQVVGSASQFVGQGQSSGDSSSMTGAGDMVSSAGTQSAKHGGVVKLRKSSSVNWLDKYEDGSETKAQTSLPAPYLNPAIVQAVLANASQPVTNTLGRVISTPTSREKERREKVVANDPSQYSVMPGFQSDYNLGIQEPGADNSVLSDPIAMAAALTAGGVGLGAIGLSQVPRMFLGNLASEATVGLTDVGKYLTRNTALKNARKLNPSQLPGSPNVVSSVDDVVTQSWQMQEMPGLHLKSTMEGQAISKIVEPKTGLVNTEQALAIIGKESGGAEKVAMIKKAFGDNIPQKMDYNDFRKTVQDQLIPLERQFATGRSNYGIENLGYIPLQQSGTRTERFQNFMNTPINNLFKKPELLENQTLILGNKSKFGRGSSAHGNPEETLGHVHFLRDAETPDVLTVTQIQSDAFQGTHRIMPKNAPNVSKTQQQIERLKTTVEENKRIINEYKTNKIDGSGHTVHKSQIDQLEDITRKQEQDILFKEADLKNLPQKQLLDKNHQERYLQELVDYAGKRGDVNKIRVPTSETAANVQGYYKQPFNIGDISDESLITYNNLKKQKENAEQLLTIGKNITEKEKAELLSVINNPELKKIEMLQKYSPKDQTIIKKYSEQPKLIKKLFDKEPAIVTDSKGNTWYEFDIPESFKQGKGQIKAFGLAPTVLGAGALGKYISDNKSNPEQTYGKGGSVNNNWLDKYN